MCSKIQVPTNHLCLKQSYLSTMILFLLLGERIKRKPQKKSQKELILSLQTKCKKKTQTNCNVFCFFPFNSRTVVYLFDQTAMMIKHTLSLSIDNSDDDWICIHTPIPDYQMAYHINKIFSVLLRRRPEDYASNQAGQKFPIFSYQRRKEGVHWHLIRNKVKTMDSPNNESQLFSTAETRYLFKQLNGIDYLLSVGVKESENIQKNLGQLPDIQSCYSLPEHIIHLKQQLSF